MQHSSFRFVTLSSTLALTSALALGCSDGGGAPVTADGTPAEGVDSGSSSGSGGGDSASGGSSSGAGALPPAGPVNVDGTPLELNGQLEVCGTQLCNQHGKPIQLRGMSTHGLQWYGVGDCVTEDSLDSLANDWGADILRISLYVQEGGYETDPEGFTADVDQIIEWVTDRGMYALIDWHMLSPGDPNENLDLAKTYFTHIAETHGDKDNLLYEIANEPNGVSWSAVKTYANEMIPLIRGIDPEAVVIVGTPDWASFGLSGSGSPDDVVNDQLDFDNVMYTFHFYAASHQGYYRNEVFPVADKLPIFVTEWGTQEYTGDGPNDFNSAQLYIDWMAEKKISWTSWNFSDDERSGAAFTQGSCGRGEFTGDALKEAGAWVQERILSPGDDFPTE